MDWVGSRSCFLGANWKGSGTQWDSAVGNWPAQRDAYGGRDPGQWIWPSTWAYSYQSIVPVNDCGQSVKDYVSEKHFKGSSALVLHPICRSLNFSGFWFSLILSVFCSSSSIPNSPPTTCPWSTLLTPPFALPFFSTFRRIQKLLSTMYINIFKTVYLWLSNSTKNPKETKIIYDQGCSLYYFWC